MNFLKVIAVSAVLISVFSFTQSAQAQSGCVEEHREKVFMLINGMKKEACIPTNEDVRIGLYIVQKTKALYGISLSDAVDLKVFDLRADKYIRRGKVRFLRCGRKTIKVIKWIKNHLVRDNEVDRLCDWR